MSMALSEDHRGAVLCGTLYGRKFWLSAEAQAAEAAASAAAAKNRRFWQERDEAEAARQEAYRMYPIIVSPFAHQSDDGGSGCSAQNAMQVSILGWYYNWVHTVQKGGQQIAKDVAAA